MGEAQVAPPGQRGVLRLLLDPVFGGFFWGKLIATSAVWVHGVVAAIVTFDATGSALAVGLVTAAQFTPQLLLTPLAGTWADRGYVWMQMLWGRVLCVLSSGALGVWSWIDADDQAGWDVAWPVILSSLAVGFGFVIGGPALQAVVPRMVTTDELPTAMMLNTVPITFARIGGPLLGTVMLSAFGPWSALGLAAACHGAFAVILVAIRLPPEEDAPTDSDFSVRAALRYVAQSRPLRLVLLATAAAGVGGEPSLSLAPALAHELGGEAALVGMMTAAFGAGSGAGFLVFTLLERRLSVESTVPVGLAVMAVGLSVTAIVPIAPVGLAGLAVSGLGFTLAVSASGTLAQLLAPDELRGRIMALWIVGFIGGRPLAGFVLGGLTDLTSSRAAVGVVSVLMFAATVASMPRNLRAASPKDTWPVN